MFILIIAIVLAAGAAASPQARRYVKKRRLSLAEASEAQEDGEKLRKAKAEAAAAAFKEGLRSYFAGHRIKVVERMSTPRAADMGTLYLMHPVTYDYHDDDGRKSGTYRCHYGCAEVIAMREIAAAGGNGVDWHYLGRYCPICGALSLGYNETRFPHGPLGKRLNGATNLFDVLGDPKKEAEEEEWTKLEAEEKTLEARLGGVRTRRLVLAEKLGKPIAGGPFRPRLVAKNE